MKTLMALILLSTSGLALADSAKFNVGLFKGELKIEPADVKVQSINMNARLQFCNFWGTTCAGGPSSTQEAAISFKQDSRTNLLMMKNDTSIELKASKVGNRFSSCNLNIALSGVGADGAAYEGYLRLIHINDKDICGSKKEISEAIAEALKVPQTIKMWKKY